MKNPTKINDSRYLSAIERYLNCRGYDVTRLNDPDIDFLAVDGDIAALVAVTASEEELVDEPLTRKAYESAMLNAAKLGLIEVGMSVRLDSIAICVVGCERAMIRHHLGRFDD